MPRQLPHLDVSFQHDVDAALILISRIEAVNAFAQGRQIARLSTANIELSYELSYLRIFLSWEVLLEESLLRLLCGYRHSGGQEPLRQNQTYFRTIADAEAAILGNQLYKLWHNPGQVINRARAYLNNSRYEIIVASAQARLQHFAAIRHRIAHAQDHAAREFDQATMSLAGRRYPGSRPGNSFEIAYPTRNHLSVGWILSQRISLHSHDKFAHEV
ncbi:hypothetical protein [Mesorhizobium sp. WSM4904]|uniref:hypothetical protein n=1 Tax=Mesorhizobium sp. WSM4904 TaxID=3038545 RepID=UPI0024186742|nr:hypothetical protein [Mesorhizobium sp. WSM4904]WFP65479.1 hypothetical protein QAZ47_13495 [Mesorhizobium sp. WSM4904]